MKRTVTLLAAILLGAGCARAPSERACYRAARDAVRAAPDLPKGAVLAPLSETRIQVAKNAARVQLPYEYVTASGETATDSYVVWLRRIARRWELDRYYPAPKYPSE